MMPEQTSKDQTRQTPTPISEMTDREIAEETLYWLREAGGALVQLQQGGMSKLMLGMLGGKK